MPDRACRTIWSELPDAAGKSFWSKFNADADCVFGKENFVENASPAARLAANDPTSAISHTASTILR